ncbi:MAG: translation initiation factor IF-3 [Litorivicinus sp.]
MRGAPAAPRHMINEAIRSPQVRLIGPNGDQIGVVATRDAIVAAKENDLDLVMISENADPPVAKIMDYGKKLYEDKKAKNEAKKKQVQTKLKEIKFRPGTDDGDYKIKVKHMIEFLDHGDKVKVTIRFRGREMAHQDLGVKLLNRVEEELAEIANVESRPTLEGRQMVMVFAPKSRKGKS